MKEPVDRPEYWRERLARCGGELHRAIYNGSIDQFEPFNKSHKAILLQEIQPTDRVIDIGCGYGRLLGLMPCTWQGQYLGVDISPEFIQIAQMTYAARDAEFMLADARDLKQIPDRRFDVALLGSIRGMVTDNLGIHAWDDMVREIDRVAKRMIFLEYA